MPIDSGKFLNGPKGRAMIESIAKDYLAIDKFQGYEVLGAFIQHTIESDPLDSCGDFA